MSNNRLELTWIGKDEKINPEPRILMYDEANSYGDQNTENLLIHGDNLLADDGRIWISIDDDEGHYLKVLCDEFFGRNNFVNTVIREKKYSLQNDAKWLSDSHDFILVMLRAKIIGGLIFFRAEKNKTNTINIMIMMGADCGVQTMFLLKPFLKAVYSE